MPNRQANGEEANPQSAGDQETLESQWPESRNGRSLLVIYILTAVFIFLGAFWTIHSSQINAACQVGEAVPPIPAVATLFFLTIVARLLRRFAPSLALTRREILVIYSAVVLGVYFTSLGGAEYLFSYITGPFYFHSPENQMEALWPHIPTWLVPHDTTVIAGMYEKTEGGRVPWAAWVGPLAVWLLFFVVLFGTTYCIFSLLRRRWVEEERLSFPLVQLALRLTEEDTPTHRPFLRDPVMWIGFGLAVIFNLANVLHAIDPSFPAMWKGARLRVADPVWRPFQMTLRYDPLALGLGYLMSLEMLFSVWFSFLFTRLQAVVLRGYGYSVRGWQVSMTQGVGSYLAMFLLIIFAVRRHLFAAAKALLRWQDLPGDDQEPLSARAALLGAVLRVVLLCGFCAKAGMGWWLAATFLGIGLAFAIVYGRVRAQAGAPYVWLFPLHQQSLGIPRFLGTGPILSTGGPRALTMLYYFGFLARGYPMSFPATQLDATRVAGVTGFPRRRMGALLMFAVVVGLVAAFYFHLTAYYTYGNNHMATVKNPGELRRAVSAFDRAAPPNSQYRALVATGFGTALLLAVARRFVPLFPIHPLGFAIATTYASPLWFPFLVAWLSKLLLLRYGGLKAYRRMIPFFLGLTFGHFMAGGAVWSLLRTFGGEFFRSVRYGVFFG